MRSKCESAYRSISTSPPPLFVPVLVPAAAVVRVEPSASTSRATTTTSSSSSSAKRDANPGVMMHRSRRRVPVSNRRRRRRRDVEVVRGVVLQTHRRRHVHVVVRERIFQPLLVDDVEQVRRGQGDFRVVVVLVSAHVCCC